MMWYSHGELGWIGWTLMSLSMLVFWAVVPWGIWTLWRSSQRGFSASHGRTPEQVLAHRFAAGEIDAAAYREARDTLSEHGRSAVPR